MVRWEYMKHSGKIWGFTLIEILVVISIIGILVAILTASFNQGRAQSRDRVRMSALKELQLSIELYKAQNGRYPEMGCGTATPGGGGPWSGKGNIPVGNTWGGIVCNPYILGLVPEYISDLPGDPLASNVGIIYTTNSIGSAYKLLLGGVESMLVTSYDNEFARCPSSCGVGHHCGPTAPQTDVYATYSTGAECW